MSGNKTNDGKLFTDDGRPFWMVKKKGVVVRAVKNRRREIVCMSDERAQRKVIQKEA